MTGTSSPAVLKADLVLEGGGVKGVGLVGEVLVLDEAALHNTVTCCVSRAEGV